MKKIYTLIVAIMLFAGVSESQNINFWINLDSADNYNQINILGNSYTNYYDIANMNYTLADTATMHGIVRYIEVAFDTLVNAYSGFGNVAYSGSQYPTVQIDSIMAWVDQVNHSGLADTIICKIMSVDGNGYPSSTIYWSDTTIIPWNNPIQGAFITAPFIQLSTNKFCVRLEYYGPLIDTFGFIFGMGNTGPCFLYPQINAPVLSTYYPNSFEWYIDTGGYNQQYPTINGQDLITTSCDSFNTYPSLFQNICIYAKVELTGSVNCNGLTVTTNPTDAQCSNCADGWISCAPSGGTPPYHYSWNTIPVQITQDATGLLPGTYTVSVTDSNNCTIINTATIGNASICSANFLLYPDSIPHTWYIINQSYGVPPVHYDWNWGDLTAHDTIQYPAHTYADSGMYTICLSILDAAGCSTSYCNSYYLNRTSNSMVNIFVLGSSSGIKEIQNNTFVDIIPNPNNGNFVLSYHFNSQFSTLNSQFHITDVMGRVVYDKTIPDTDGTMNINASELGSGIYYWEVITNSKIIGYGKIAVVK
jgi:PKD repeat protein